MCFIFVYCWYEEGNSRFIAHKKQQNTVYSLVLKRKGFKIKTPLITKMLNIIGILELQTKQANKKGKHYEYVS